MSYFMNIAVILTCAFFTTFVTLRKDGSLMQRIATAVLWALVGLIVGITLVVKVEGIE